MKHKKSSNANFIYHWNNIYIVIYTCIDEAKQQIWYQCKLIITHDSRKKETMAHEAMDIIYDDRDLQMFVEYLHYCFTTPFPAEMCEQAFKNIHDIPALVRKRYILESF